MPLLVRAFPVLPGRESDLVAFAQELTARRQETDAFYSAYGVVRESWHEQRIDDRMWIIGVTEFSDASPAVQGERYRASTTAFDTWFKSQILEITGIDPDAVPLGPRARCLYDWRPGDATSGALIW